MARPIWSGTLSFGLLNVPVQLVTAERGGSDISFRMLDSRDRKPIRFERVNAETGEEVPWKDIVKAFEYDKGSYVVLEEGDIRSAAPESHETVEVESFVEATQIDPRYYEKPYLLVPGKKAEKGYVLLRETLRRTGKVGIARVVVRTREYLCTVMPHQDALVLMILRYPQELVDHAALTYSLLGPSPEWRFQVDGEPVVVPLSSRMDASDAAPLVSVALGVLVLREGRLVEHLQTGRLDSARHPYTRALLDAAAF